MDHDTKTLKIIGIKSVKKTLSELLTLLGYVYSYCFKLTLFLCIVSVYNVYSTWRLFIFYSYRVNLIALEVRTNTGCVFGDFNILYVCRWCGFIYFLQFFIWRKRDSTWWCSVIKLIKQISKGKFSQVKIYKTAKMLLNNMIDMMYFPYRDSFRKQPSILS